MQDAATVEGFYPATEKQVVNKPFPSLAQGFGLLGYIILANIILAIPFVALHSESGEVSEMIMYSGSFLIVIWIGNLKRRSTGFSFKAIPVSLYFLILLLIPAWVVIIEPVVNLIPMTEWGKSLLENFRPDSFLKIALIVVAAPILEELLFRGVILHGFLKRYTPWKAIVLSSFLFGLIHLNPWQFVVAFCLGIFMGWLYWKTRSLIPCIFMHHVNNAAATIFNLSFGTRSTEEQTGEPLAYAVLFGSCCVVVVSCYYIASKVLKRSEQLK